MSIQTRVYVNVPPTLDFQPALLQVNKEIVGGLEAFYAFKKGLVRVTQRAEGKIVVNDGVVGAIENGRMCQQCFDFRGEREESSIPIEVKRLDAIYP